MRVLIQSKEETTHFLKALQEKYELIAPVNKDLVRFEQITDPNTIYLEKNAYFPLKEYFFPHQQTMFLFIGQEMEEKSEEAPPRIFFGVRKCDLNAIHNQDNVFITDGNDPYYENNRKNSILIGYHCEEPPSKSCFCGSLNLKEHHDLMYYDKGDHYLIETGSEQGEKLTKEYKQHFKKHHRQLTQEEKTIHFSDRLKKTNIKDLYDHPDWKKGVDICLSCGACTALCPTCYCFEIYDEVRADNTKAGSRERSWSSCMLTEFTKVAGEHIFREDREERFKHRIYHQMQYYKDKYGSFLCTGCGRCIDGCPTRIDWVNLINEME